MADKFSVKNTKKYGRGLYANKNIKKGEIVEVSPVLIIDRDDAKRISDTIVNVYVFEWNRQNSALALGNGSLFNHSKKSNVSYMNSFSTKEVIFISNKEIKKGQQLFINYGYDPAHGIEVTLKNKEVYLRKEKASLDNKEYTVDRMMPKEDKEYKEASL